MYEVVVKTDFAAAHRLLGYEGNCERLHGHNWKIEVRVKSDRLNKLGMVADFREIKQVVKDVVGELDHHYLNEMPPFDKLNPTTENIAKFLFDELARMLPAEVRPAAITAWESDGCGVSYIG